MPEAPPQIFATERRAAVLLQAGATLAGAFLPAIAAVFYLAVSVLSVVKPLRHLHIRRRRSQRG